MKRVSVSKGGVLAAGVIVLAALHAACSKTPEPAPEKPPETSSGSGAASKPATPSATATATTTAGPADVAWDAPPAWTSVPNTNPMRKATYKIPKAPGDAEDAELTVSSAGGGIMANVKRWSEQFGNAQPKSDKRKVNGLDVTIVEIKGNYTGMSMGAGGAAQTKQNQMLLGAVVDGSTMLHFFKMVGPEKTVLAAKPDFEKLVASLRAK